MFDLNLYQFAYSGTGGSQIPDNKIPFHVSVFLQLLFQKFIISIADNIFQKIFLLDFNCFLI